MDKIVETTYINNKTKEYNNESNANMNINSNNEDIEDENELLIIKEDEYKDEDDKYMNEDDSCMNEDDEYMNEYDYVENNKEIDYISDYDESDININFENDINDHKLKLIDINEDIIEVDKLLERTKYLISQVSENLKVTKDEAYLILKKFNFSYEQVINCFCSETDFKKKLPELINIKVAFIGKPLIIQKINKGNCPIYYNENCDLYQNYCGHSCCFNCIKREIEIQIKEKKFPISCRIDPDNCNAEIMPHEIEKFVGKEKANKYFNDYFENHIHINKKYVKCPSPNCPYFLKKCSFHFCNLGQCKCGKIFCIECQQNDHSPLKCEQIYEWEKISQKIKNLKEDQDKWVKREILLWNIRRINIDEIEKAVNMHLKQHQEKYEENEEIKSLENTLNNEKDEIEKKKLNYHLQRKVFTHKFNINKKNSEIKFFTNYVNNYKNALNKNERIFIDRQTNFLYFIETSYIEKTVKKCPKCNSNIVKDGGCDHITCPICKHQFCYICLKDWYLHTNGCPVTNNIQNDTNVNNQNDNQNNGNQNNTQVNDNQNNTQVNGNQNNTQVNDNQNNTQVNDNQNNTQVNDNQINTQVIDNQNNYKGNYLFNLFSWITSPII